MGGAAGSAPQQQHPLGAGLPHQAGVLPHSRLLAGVLLLSPVHAVRHDGFPVEHPQPVGVLAATFVLCNNKIPVKKAQSRRFSPPGEKPRWKAGS